MATELGKAYVQIVPSAKGISGAITKELGPEAETAGETTGRSLGSKMVSAIKTVVAAAAIGKFFAASLQEGAALEQSLGGVETLFKDSADKVKANANQAYKTAGVSANEYMENVTSFSASLLQSTAGDTSKAADIAHTAMVDMSDNANKMGTDMRDIQNAYQGFAKQNYTMLDNLKLGYGGTKSEMERLLQDAQAFSGVEYDIDNLSDVYEAIHVIQQEMDITGTTAIEAAETFSGSFGSMKAAAQNALGALALGENIGPALTGLAETVSTFLFGNFIPMVITILQSLIPAIVAFFQTAGPLFMEQGSALLSQMGTGISTGIPLLLEKLIEITAGIQLWVQEQLPVLIQNGIEWILGLASGMLESMPGIIDSMGQILANILSAILDAAPAVLQGGFDLIAGLARGLWDNLPAVVTSITNLLSNLIRIIIEKGPDITRKGFELIGKLAKGLWDNLPEIITTIGNILINLVKKIGEHLPEMLDKGWELIKELAKGLVKGIPDAVRKIPEIIRALVNKVSELVSEFFKVGGDLIRGLWRGINDVKGWILGKISGFVDSIVGGIKNFFGIRSPSRVFMEIGKQLDQGLAKGITDNAKPVEKAMDELGELTQRSFESELAMRATASATFGEMASQVATGQTTSTSHNPTPANVIFEMAGHKFTAFVEDITKLQDRQVELELAY